MSTVVVTRRPSPVEDYGLGAIAAHNVQGTERFPQYEDQALAIYHDGYGSAYQTSYVQNTPTPSSSDGVRTRSGRTTQRTDSPFSTAKSRASKSPVSKPKKNKKSKLDRSKTPQLTAPLSVLTKDMDVPLKDMHEWVNRSAEVRRQEVEKRNGYVTRPMNSFMLYRSCYADRTKQWCTQNNHQVVSSVSGESWPMEPPEVKDRFTEWSKIERANHAAAHPDYKFSPSKSTNKRRKDDDSDVEDEASELGDPDGEYRGARGGRNRRQRTQEPEYIPSSHSFETTPYYQQPSLSYEQALFQYGNPGLPLPLNVAYDQQGLPYDPQTNTYIQNAVQHPQYQYAVQEPPRAPTPSLGSYGLPGGQAQVMFTSSRTSTPMQQYNQYGQPVYHQQYAAQPYPPNPYGTPGPQMFSEHQQYLQSQSQPQEMIDPSLAAILNEQGAQGLPVSAHFETAIGDFAGDFQLEYYDQQTSADATLAPQWSPADALK